MRIARQIGGDAEQRIAPVRFVLVRRARAQEAVVAVLKQIVGLLPIARDARQIRPEWTGCPVVKGPEGLLVHLQHDVGVTDAKLERPGAGEGHVTRDHWSVSIAFVSVVAGGSNNPSRRDRKYDTAADRTNPMPRAPAARVMGADSRKRLPAGDLT